MPCPDDFALTLTTDNGSLPPPYRKSERITLDASGVIHRRRTRGYVDSDVTETTATLAREAMDALADDLDALGLFETAWTAPERPSVGGGGTTLCVTSYGVHTSPKRRDSRPYWHF
jgi:hypothetical protein